MDSITRIALNILSLTPEYFPNDNNISQQPEVCLKCSEEISPSLPKPLVLLTCRHVLHFECIDNERRLCPQCPSIDDQGYYVTPSIPARESNQKKRKKNYESDSKSRSNRGTKPQEIIQELSVDNQIPDSRELLPISVPSENTNTEKKTDQLNHLYYEIDVAEKKGDQANWEAIQSYFRFGEALSIRLTSLLKNNPPQLAHTKLNSEVREHLPENTTHAIVRKRTDTARKIYDIFSVIGDDKICRIKSYTASSFSDLTRSEVKYIIENFPTHK